jgi:hypothetical protein
VDSIFAVQLEIIARRLDPLDLLKRHQPGAVPFLDEKALQPRAGAGLLQRPIEPLGQILGTSATELMPSPLDGQVEPVRRDGFEQVVEGASFKGLDCIVIEGRSRR